MPPREEEEVQPGVAQDEDELASSTTHPSGMDHDEEGEEKEEEAVDEEQEAAEVAEVAAADPAGMDHGILSSALHRLRPLTHRTYMPLMSSRKPWCFSRTLLGQAPTIQWQPGTMCVCVLVYEHCPP